MEDFSVTADEIEWEDELAESPELLRDLLWDMRAMDWLDLTYQVFDRGELGQ